MRLIDLWIDGFGKLNNELIGFSEGTNLITGRNEAGKSTVYACLRAMFFGMMRAKGVAALTDTYSHYKPWFAKNYGAKLRVEVNGHVYSIQRDFLKDPVGCTVFDETTMEAVPYADRFVAGLLLNMSEETYDNTISISRLKNDGSGNLNGELKKYIVNMDTTGSHALNCTRARAYLNDQKRKLAEGISPEASKEYAVNCSEIKRLEKCIREFGAVAVANDVAEKIAEKAAEDKKATEEAKKAAEEVKAANDELAALRTEMQCLDAEIISARDTLRSHSVYSSSQVEKAKAEFSGELGEYQKKSGQTAVNIFRVLYIVFFVLAFLDILATAYVFGSNFAKIIFLGSAGLGIILLVLGVAFLILCIISKNNCKMNEQEFGKVLEHYTGYDEVTPERIDRVKNKLEELSKIAKEVEGKETQLAELSQKAQEKEEAVKAAEAAFAEMPAVVTGVVAGIAVQENVAPENFVEEVSDGAHPQSQNIQVNESINKINGLKARNVGLKELLRKNDAINEEIDAIDMALEKLDELADTMKDSLGVHLNARASEYISEITKGAYDSLSVDDELNVFMNTKEKMVPIEQVSNGTSDQIYMALRMAGARLVQNGEDRLPLIFDDSFVNYDDERLAATLTWLVKEYGGQVIIFSCQNREEKLLRENGLTFNPIHL